VEEHQSDIERRGGGRAGTQRVGSCPASEVRVLYRKTENTQECEQKKLEREKRKEGDFLVTQGKGKNRKGEGAEKHAQEGGAGGKRETGARRRAGKQTKKRESASREPLGSSLGKEKDRGSTREGGNIKWKVVERSKRAFRMWQRSTNVHKIIIYRKEASPVDMSARQTSRGECLPEGRTTKKRKQRKKSVSSRGKSQRRGK